MFKRLIAAVALLGIVASASAQQFPSKPLRIIVPFPAGSATDTVARILAGSVSQAMGQPVIVDNKAGADGAIAGTEVAKAAPDGYTLLLATNSPMSVVPVMRKDPPYDPLKDFTPITDIGRYTFFIVVHPSVPAKTLKELVDYAKANPNKINYATGNTTGIVSTALFQSLAGIQMLHVPYKGEPQAITDMLANRVQLIFASSTTSVPHIRDGKLRAIVTTLPKRSPILPEVPTIAEAGMPEFSIVSWAALFGPANLPREVTARLNKEFVAAMGRPDVQAAMEKQAFALSPSSPERLGAYVKEQLEAYRKVIEATGMKGG
ncbi:MAG TPA: tripartite tricarboxylate transporter substrate binding protein [Burkholderiales bacterium]|nr:tripartite tricarboxylate transporter substrate binding protein [Burkholderiales bacterium]